MKQPDAIIVGGGMQGVSMALAMARRGLRPLIVERSELAAGASGSSYGIVHGGLRYLQSLDILRWRRSRRAQAWFLREFPAHVQPLRCVMPLYKRRLRSPGPFRLAIGLEKTLVAMLDAQVPLPPPQLLTAQEVRQEFDVPGEGLVGGACWHDAEVVDMAALLQAMLHRAGLSEADVLTPFAATALLVEDDRVAGLQARHAITGETLALHSPVVVNCAGSWCGSWQHEAECPSAYALAFNLLLEGQLPNNSALAVSVIPGKGRSYFVRSHPQGVFVGTYYRPASGSSEPAVSEADIRNFLDELDAALPGWSLGRAQVKAVMAGLLPDKDGSGRKLSAADHILIHRPHGFYSVLGGKFTTAPLLSEEAAAAIWPLPVINDELTTHLAKHHG